MAIDKLMRRTLALTAGLTAAVFLLGIVTGCGDDQKTSTSATTGTTTEAAPLPDTGGRMAIAETSYDFGSVPVGQLVEHEFVVKNTGTGPLELGQLAVKRLEGCWDAQAVVGSTTIAPGGSSTVKVSMHMGKGMGGPHLFEVTINSSDPAPAVNKVSVRANFTE